MRVLLAKHMGFCWGVRRAINLMEEAAHERGPMKSLGPIVHNQQVMDKLAQHGVEVVATLDAVGDAPVAITAHGVGPQVVEEMRERRLDVVDTTCPIVTRAQRWAKKMADNGFTVIIYGDTNHREVRGTLAWARGKGLALADDDLDYLPEDFPNRLAIMAQTTQNPARFAAFVSHLVTKRIEHISELRIINTLCNVTSNQQEAARELARQVEVMVVVGGRQSANTRHLMEVCQEEGTTTYHIETACELDPRWFTGVEWVGLTAGASTPDFVVEAVVERLREFDLSKAATEQALPCAE